jgi:hypothetical protein
MTPQPAQPVAPTREYREVIIDPMKRWGFVWRLDPRPQCKNHTSGADVRCLGRQGLKALRQVMDNFFSPSDTGID